MVGDLQPRHRSEVGAQVAFGPALDVAGEQEPGGAVVDLEHQRAFVEVVVVREEGGGGVQHAHAGQGCGFRADHPGAP